MKLLKQVDEIIELARREDRADLTSRLLFDPGDRIKAVIVAREAGTICGAEFAAMTFRKYDPSCRIRIFKKDGARVRKGDDVMRIEGRAVALLTAERKAVNFLQHLSGVATLTSGFVRAVRGTKSKIYDTRKTIPGIRLLQKYAVLCGGGRNHRMDLSEMAMVKDNHLKVVGGEWWVVSLKSRLPKGTLLEIEAKTMKEVLLAFKAGADIVMLDNMSLSRLKKMVRFIRHHPLPTTHHPPLIEVSGGVTLKDVRKIADLGVERISVGALTHSAPALNLSMDAERAGHG